jgi:hypothetical protein
LIHRNIGQWKTFCVHKKALFSKVWEFRPKLLKGLPRWQSWQDDPADLLNDLHSDDNVHFPICLSSVSCRNCGPDDRWRY